MEYLLVFATGIALGLLFVKAYSEVTTEDLQRDKDNAELRVMKFARKLKAIEDILNKANKRRMLPFEVIEDIKKVLFTNAN